jgi:hypothetical protein
VRPEAMLADAVCDATLAAHEPVIGRGDARARLATAFECARADSTQATTGTEEARAALLALGVAYGGGDTITCHGEPLIVPEGEAPWAACQKCGGRYGLRALARLAPDMATKVEGK